MNNLKKEYVIQVRNALFLFLNRKAGLSVELIGDIFGVNKSTVSRQIKEAEEGNADKRLLLELTKYFK